VIILLTLFYITILLIEAKYKNIIGKNPVLTGLFRILLTPLIVLVLIILSTVIGFIGILQGAYEFVTGESSDKLMKYGRIILEASETMVMYLIGMLVIIE